MLEIRGKFNTAKVFTDIIDEDSIRQVYELCNQSFAEGAKIRMMPDVHAGAGCVIGTTMTITDRVVPNMVGVDIGCGMETVRIKGRKLEVEQLDKLIKFNVSSGFDIREKQHRYAEKHIWRNSVVRSRSILTGLIVRLGRLAAAIILSRLTRVRTAFTAVRGILELRWRSFIRNVQLRSLNTRVTMM